MEKDKIIPNKNISNKEDLFYDLIIAKNLSEMKLYIENSNKALYGNYQLWGFAWEALEIEKGEINYRDIFWIDVVLNSFGQPSKAPIHIHFMPNYKPEFLEKPLNELEKNILKLYLILSILKLCEVIKNKQVNPISIICQTNKSLAGFLQKIGFIQRGAGKEEGNKLIQSFYVSIITEEFLKKEDIFKQQALEYTKRLSSLSCFNPSQKEFSLVS